MTARPDATLGADERWIKVNGSFDELVTSLCRADDKGYMPDALAGEWEKFDWSEDDRSALASPAVVVSAEPVVLLDLICDYWDIAVAEGREGRNHDTVDGKASALFSKIAGRVKALEALATPVGPDAVDARLRGWKFTPDEEGMSVVSPSGDACYLWDLDSQHVDQFSAGMCIREVMRQLCQEIAFGSPLPEGDELRSGHLNPDYCKGFEDGSALLNREAALWREWLPWMRWLNKKPFDLAMAIDRFDAALASTKPSKGAA